MVESVRLVPCEVSSCELGFCEMGFGKVLYNQCAHSCTPDEISNKDMTKQWLPMVTTFLGPDEIVCNLATQARMHPRQVLVGKIYQENRTQAKCDFSRLVRWGRLRTYYIHTGFRYMTCLKYDHACTLGHRLFRPSSAALRPE